MFLKVIIIVGGSNSGLWGGESDDVLIYDIENNSWITNKPKLPTKLFFATIVEKNGYIYSFGGCTRTYEPLKNVYRIKTDFQSNWEELPDMPEESKLPMVVPYN